MKEQQKNEEKIKNEQSKVDKNLKEINRLEQIIDKEDKFDKNEIINIGENIIQNTKFDQQLLQNKEKLDQELINDICNTKFNTKDLKENNNQYEKLHTNDLNDLFNDNKIMTINKNTNNIWSKGSICYPITIPLWIHHKKLIGLIDTGASHSLISHNLLLDANPNYEIEYKKSKSKLLFGVSGSKLDILSDRLITIYIPNYGNLKLKISIIRTDEKMILLGRDFINKSKLSIIFIRNNTFILKFKHKKPLHVIQKIQHTKNEPWIKNNNKIIVNAIKYHEIYTKNSLQSFNNFKTLIKLSNLLIIQQISTTCKDFLHFMKNIQTKNIIFNLNKILLTISKTIKLKQLSINLPNLVESKIQLFSPILINYIYKNKISVSNILDKIDIKYNFIYKFYYRLKHFPNVYKFIENTTFEELITFIIMISKFTKSEEKKSIIDSTFHTYTNKIYKKMNKINIIKNTNNQIMTDTEFLETAKKDTKLGIDIDQLILKKSSTIKDILEELQVDTPEHKNDLAKYIMENNIVSRFEMDCGILNNTIEPLHIELDPNQPIYKNTQPYSLNFEDEQMLKKIMNYLVQRGLARISPRGFGAPVFLIRRPQPNRMPRLLVDNRKNNKLIKNSTNTSMPECFQTLRNYLPHCKWLTCIDLKEAFYCLRASEKTIQSGILNILTPFASYELTRLMTGNSLSPNFLIYNLSKYLHMNSSTKEFDLICMIIQFYDDICVLSDFNKTLNEHIDQVKTVLHRLAYIGFKINAKKSRFYIDMEKDSVKVLGYLFGQNQIRIPSQKIQSLTQIKIPDNIKDLQVFLGSINYFRNLLPVSIHASINFLYRQTKNFVWSNTCSLHFSKIIEALKNETHFIKPPFKNGINFLICDGSKLGIGSTLLSYSVSHLLKKVKINHYKFHENEHFIKQTITKYNQEPYYLSKNTDFFEAIFNALNELNYSIKDIKNLKEHVIINSSIEYKLKNYLPHEGLKDKYLKQQCEHLLNNDFEFEYQNDYIKNLIYYSLTNIFSLEIVLIQYNTKLNDYTAFSFNPQEEKLYILYINQEYHILYFKDSKHYKQTIPKFTSKYFEETDIKHNFYNDLKNGTKDYLKNKVNIIGFFSQSINEDLFRKSSICFIELLAIFQSLEFFEHYFTTKIIYILTDSSVAHALLSTSKNQKKSSKLENLSQKIFFWYQHYSIYVLKIEGLENFSDFLSRMLPEHYRKLKFIEPIPTEKTEKYEIYPLKPKKINLEETMKKQIFKVDEYFYQINKEYLNKISYMNTINVITNKQLPYKPFTNLTRTYLEMFYNILKKEHFIQLQIQEIDTDINPTTIKYYENKIYLPLKLYTFIIGITHGSLSHPGISRLYNYINTYYYVKNKTHLSEIIKKLNSNCLTCLANKNQIQNYKLGSAFSNNVYQPNFMITSDLLDLPKKLINGDKHGIKHLLIIQDIFSKYVTIYCLPTATQKAIIQNYANYFAQHGLVKYHLSDNASIYRGHDINKYFKILNIMNMNSSPLSSKSRGLIERCVQTINQYIRVQHFEPMDMIDLAKTITEISHALNQVPLKGTFLTPFNVQFVSLKNFEVTGYDQDNFLIAPFSKLSHTHKEDYDKIANELNKSILNHRENFTKIKKEQLEKININKTNHPFRINDLVIIKNVLHKKLFHLYYLKLFRVIEERSHTLKLEDILTKQHTNRKVQHCKKIDVQEKEYLDLDIKLIDKLKIITPDNINSIFEIEILPTDPISTRLRSKPKEYTELNLPEEEMIPDFDARLQELGTIYE